MSSIGISVDVNLFHISLGGYPRAHLDLPRRDIRELQFELFVHELMFLVSSIIGMDVLVEGVGKIQT